MKKTLILLTGCGLLGGCMATVSPRGDVAVSYAAPVVQEEVIVPSYVAYASSSHVTYVSPLSILFHRPHHRPRPIAQPRPPVVVHNPPSGGHHPGGNGHHVIGNGHQPGGNGHNPGGGHQPGGNGHHPQQPGSGSTHVGGQGASYSGQNVLGVRPNSGAVKIKK